MATIEQNSGYATLINVFTVAPDRAADLAALLHTATEKVMRHQPGFRSANIHLSIDGTRVVNYAPMGQRRGLQRDAGHPTTQQHMSDAAALAISFDPHLYTVESVHER